MSSLSRFTGKLSAVIASFFLLGALASAGTYNIVYNFQSSGGDAPASGVIFDAAGNLYGAALYGGKGVGLECCGVIFKLAPAADGSWTYSKLYSFTGGSDGGHPYTSLVFDAAGNLYGAAYGKLAGTGTGSGTVFKLTPTASGPWTFTLLHTFVGGIDGKNPSGRLGIDAAGNLYGTTPSGGKNNQGIVYKLTAAAGGNWKETLIHTFTGCADGGIPTDLLVDAKANLYGTAYGGVCGGFGFGVAFEFSPTGSAWKQTILHHFTGGVDGSEPQMMTLDTAGNLYGVAEAAGRGHGLIFRLTPNGNGTWAESVLHDFDGQNGDYASSIALNGGNVYGTTYSGGIGDGVLFESTADTNWTETVLKVFEGGLDGGPPRGPIAFDNAGNLYGTTFGGGSGYLGVVFEYTF